MISVSNTVRTVNLGAHDVTTSRLMAALKKKCCLAEQSYHPVDRLETTLQQYGFIDLHADPKARLLLGREQQITSFIQNQKAGIEFGENLQQTFKGSGLIALIDEKEGFVCFLVPEKPEAPTPEETQWQDILSVIEAETSRVTPSSQLPTLAEIELDGTGSEPLRQALSYLSLTREPRPTAEALLQRQLRK